MPVTNIDAATLESLREAGARVVDVRNDHEVANGVIPGAEHIALHGLVARLGELDPAQPLVLYCQMGSRSAQAAQFLAGQGFAQVYNLPGGMSGWLAGGRAVAALGAASAAA